MSDPAVDQPVVLIASLMRRHGSAGVQTHMREFECYLKSQGTAYRMVTPFYPLSMPLLGVLILVRRLLEITCKPAAVWMYRYGHGLLMGVQLAFWLLVYRRCVVYAQCPVSAAIAMHFARRPSQQVVLIVHFNLSQADEWVDKGMLKRGGLQERRIKALEARTLARVDRLVFVSDFVREQVSRLIPGARAVRSEVIPNFVRPPGPPPVSSQGRPQRDLVNIGTLEPRKNQGYLIAIVAEARRRGQSLTLTLVGDGQDRPRLQRQAQELGVSDLIFFEGFQPNGREFIRGHRLYVHAARMESQGIVLLEAFSMGVPVMAPAVGGIPEVVEAGQQGDFWPLDDVSGACDALLAMLSDPQRLAGMARAASQRFTQCYEASVVASRLLNFVIHMEE